LDQKRPESERQVAEPENSAYALPRSADFSRSVRNNNMIEYISNIFLALCGLISLIAGFIGREYRLSNFIWAFACFSIACAGFLESDKELHGVKGIVFTTAFVAFLITEIIKARAKRKKLTEQSSEPYR
jgi:hypothetical protein